MSFKKALILGLILYAHTVLTAQTNFKPGYIIKNSTDTLYGKIDYRGDLLMGSICRFKSENEGVVTYSPTDISAYRFIDGKYFVSREVNGSSVFLEYLSKGKVNIYYLRDKVGDHFYIDKEGLRLSEIVYKESIVHVGDTQYYHATNRHIGILKIYMDDAPSLNKRIEELTKPDHKTLTDLAKEYNKLWTGNQTIQYQKRESLIGVNLEFTSGAITYINDDQLIRLTYPMGGVIAHLWMPRANEKIYFRTGIVFNRLETADNKSTTFKIPIQFEYIYPKSMIRPKVAFGMNIFRALNYTVAFMGGFDIRISESMFCTISYDIDFLPYNKVPILPSKAFSQSLSAGFCIKL